MSNPPIPVVQPKNLGLEFTYDASHALFRVTTVSADANNAIAKSATDGGAYLSTAAIQQGQTTYSIALVGTKVTLYSHASGVDTVVGTADTSTVDVTVTGASIDSNGILTLTESHGGAPVTVNLGAFLKQVATQASSSIAFTGLGTAASPLIASFVVDPIAGNLFQVTAAGGKVDPATMLAFINANITHALAVDTANALLKSTVGSQLATLGLTELVDVTGAHLGWALA